MDNLQFIDTETWELIDEPESVIHADKDIAETIAILNKKGYKTRASCSGHTRYELTPWFDKKENLKNYPVVVGIEESENSDQVNFYILQTGYSTYVSFSEIYEFEILPEGFRYEVDDNEHCTIRKRLKLLDDNNKICSMEEVSNRLKNTNKSLLEWAKTLKNNKK